MDEGEDVVTKQWIAMVVRVRGCRRVLPSKIKIREVDRLRLTRQGNPLSLSVLRLRFCVVSGCLLAAVGMGWSSLARRVRLARIICFRIGFIE